MRVSGVIFDFDGVFTDNKIWVDERGVESVCCSRADGLGLAMLRDAGIKMTVISTETNSVVAARCEKLGLEFQQGCGDKVAAAVSWARHVGINLEDTVFLGNDINDIDLLETVGLPVCVGDAHPRVKNIAKLVLKSDGGQGAVRELCEALFKQQFEITNIVTSITWGVVQPAAKSMGPRLWGEEEILAVSSGKIMMKRLTINAGSKGGLQYHRKRVEMGYVVSGKMIVRLAIGKKIEEKILTQGDHFIFEPGVIHQEEAIEDTVILECSTPWTNDRVRVEEMFGLERTEGLESTRPGEEVLL